MANFGVNLPHHFISDYLLSLQVDLALDVEDLMFIRVRKHFRKKKDDERPNDDHDSVWYKIKKVFFPAEDSGKKSKIGDLRPPLVSALLVGNSSICYT